MTALHVNYGLRPEADEDEAFCRALCERLGVPLVVHRAGPPVGQRAGVGARGALPRGGEARAGRGHRPHGDRPGRDRALPPGRLAGPAGAARHPRPPRRDPPAAGLDARGDRRPLPRARAAVARGRRATTRATSRATGSATSCCPRCARSIPAAEANVLRTLEILRDEAEVLDSLIDTEPSVERHRRPAAGAAAADGAGHRGRGVGQRPRRRDPRAGLARRHGHARPRRRPAGRGRVRAAAVRPRTSAAAVAGAPAGARRGRLRRRPRDVRARARRPARRRRAGPGARGAPLARGRPAAQPHAPGPLHRPQGPARAAPPAAGRGLRRRDRLGHRHRRRALPRHGVRPPRARTH